MCGYRSACKYHICWSISHSSSSKSSPTILITPGILLFQISCVTSSTELRNRMRFPYYFQLISTAENLAFAYFSVIQKYGWRKLTFLVQNENLFTVVSFNLVKSLSPWTQCYGCLNMCPVILWTDFPGLLWMFKV